MNEHKVSIEKIIMIIMILLTAQSFVFHGLIRVYVTSFTFMFTARVYIYIYIHIYIYVVCVCVCLSNEWKSRNPRNWNAHEGSTQLQGSQL